MRSSEIQPRERHGPFATSVRGRMNDMEATRILIADDHPLLRRGVRSLLETHKGWKVCGEASTGAEAVEKARLLRPDIVIIDISMPEMNGLEAIRRIRAAVPAVGILTLTVHNSEVMFRGAMEAGAQAYVPKSDADSRLIDAVETLRENRIFFSPSVSRAIMESLVHRNETGNGAEGFKVLTRRQREVLKLLAQGKSNKEVASALGISTRTAETHRYQIMNRLHLQTFRDLVLFAARNHLIDL